MEAYEKRSTTFQVTLNKAEIEVMIQAIRTLNINQVRGRVNGCLETNLSDDEVDEYADSLESKLMDAIY